tara:strand:- start:907 stop:1131 length:225 start_codon:yes stop_codon:yes gene_type:complete
MSVSKEERYAMIRRAALKIQKRNKISVSNAKLAKEVVRLDEQDYKADVRWHDGDRFVKDGYSDVYNSTMKEEWN